jgi:hypothetical protein
MVHVGITVTFVSIIYTCFYETLSTLIKVASLPSTGATLINQKGYKIILYNLRILIQTLKLILDSYTQ